MGGVHGAHRGTVGTCGRDGTRRGPGDGLGVHTTVRMSLQTRMFVHQIMLVDLNLFFLDGVWREDDGLEESLPPIPGEHGLFAGEGGGGGGLQERHVELGAVESDLGGA